MVRRPSSPLFTETHKRRQSHFVIRHSLLVIRQWVPMPPNRRAAAAIGYNPDRDAAPRLLARGKGELADRIIALAREHNIPIKEDGDLIAVLAQLDLNREIPPELYRTIAELLVWVYRVNRKWNGE